MRWALRLDTIRQRWFVIKKIKLLSIDGIAPTKENIRNGTYPLVSEFYAVTAGGGE
ncbi:hypothetical protein OL548_13750 [Lysinibacillus sp. MHQ-1]|nr:hypothetical protein OL548_13750 [Lysinibacillus sp. MHQ-1]